MKRQEFLLNLTLVVIIGALAYQMYDAHQNPPEPPVPVEDARRSTDEDEDDQASDEPETTYNAAEAARQYPNFGSKNLFAAIIPPTPPPPTPTPTPAPTPDINKALGGWRVLSVDRGEVLVEDVALTRQGSEDAVWEMKVGDTRPVDMGGGQVHTVTLKGTDETSEVDMPSAIFTMEGTTVERVLRMGDEPSAAGPGGQAQPGAPR